jgi:hypothetical protein
MMMHLKTPEACLWGIILEITQITSPRLMSQEIDFFTKSPGVSQSWLDASRTEGPCRKRARGRNESGHGTRTGTVRAQQRATELAKASKALRGFLDALASVPELDDFLGQVMAAITRHSGAVTCTLRVESRARVLDREAAQRPHWQWAEFTFA